MKRSELKQLIKEEMKSLKEDNSSIENIVNKKLKEIGFKPIKIKDIASGKFLEITSLKIDPNSVGALSAIYKSINCTIFVSIDDTKNIYLILEYKWEHPSGTNGYTVRFKYQNNKWIDII